MQLNLDGQSLYNITDHAVNETDTGESTIFDFADGTVIEVGEYIVSFVGQSGSNVDYYYDSERGYGCESRREVAEMYYYNFAHS